PRPPAGRPRSPARRRSSASPLIRSTAEGPCPSWPCGVLAASVTSLHVLDQVPDALQPRTSTQEADVGEHHHVPQQGKRPPEDKAGDRAVQEPQECARGGNP